MFRLTRVVPGATSMSIGTSTSVVPASGWRIGSGSVVSAGRRGTSLPCAGWSSSWISSRSISRSSLGIPGAAIARRSSAASSRFVVSVFCGRWPEPRAGAATGAGRADGGRRSLRHGRADAAGCEAPTGVLPSNSIAGISAERAPELQLAQQVVVGRRERGWRGRPRRRTRPRGPGRPAGRRGRGGAVAVLDRQGLEHQLGDGLERVLDADPLDGHRLVEGGVQRVHAARSGSRSGARSAGRACCTAAPPGSRRGRSRWPRGSAACSRSSRGWRRASPPASRPRSTRRRRPSAPSGGWRCRTPARARCRAGSGCACPGSSRSRSAGSRRTASGPSPWRARASCPCS